MRAAILARFVLLEARRGGLPWLAAGCLLAALALAAFLSRVALTESAALQASITAALLRAGGVFLLLVHVSSSTLREQQDKGLELMLSLPLARRTHYLGRLAGHAVAGALIALLFAPPLLLWAPPAAVAAWGLSLAFELALVAAAALFFSMSLGLLVPAIAAGAGLYLLARAIGALQAIAGSPLAESGVAGRAAQWSVDALALILPRLDAATRSEWLLYGAPTAGELGGALAGLALYALLLTAAGLFDFQRRNL